MQDTQQPTPRRTRILGVLLAIVALVGGIYTATDGYPLLGLLVGALGAYGGIEVARSS
jgi:uncharacterized membrane protein